MSVTFRPHNMFDPDQRTFTYDSMCAFLKSPDFVRWCNMTGDAVFIGVCIEPYGYEQIKIDGKYATVPRKEHTVVGHYLEPDGTHTWWVAGYLSGDGVLTIPSFKCEQFKKATKP